MEPVKIDLMNLRSFEIFVFPLRFLLIKGMAPGACVCARSVNQARFIKRRFVKLDPAKDLGTCATHALSALVSSSIG